MHTVYIPHKTQSIVLVDDNLLVRPGKPGHMEVQWIQWFQTHTNDIHLKKISMEQSSDHPATWVLEEAVVCSTAEYSRH